MAAPVITVAVNKSRKSTIIAVTAVAGSTITLYRIVQGVRTIVRGAAGALHSGTEMLLVDYEVPQNLPITYIAEAVKGGSTLASTPVDVAPFDFGGDVIFDLGMPWAGIPVIVESFITQTYSIQREVISVWDRPDPVVVSGVRQFPSGTLQLLTLELTERKALLDTIRSGNLIAFSPWKPEYGLDSLTYFSIGNVQEERPSRLAIEPSRRWSLEVQQVRQPPATFTFPTGSKTWQNVKNSGVWQNLTTEQWHEVAGF